MGLPSSRLVSPLSSATPAQVGGMEYGGPDLSSLLKQSASAPVLPTTTTTSTSAETNALQGLIEGRQRQQLFQRQIQGFLQGGRWQ